MFRDIINYASIELTPSNVANGRKQLLTTHNSVLTTDQRMRGGSRN